MGNYDFRNPDKSSFSNADLPADRDWKRGGPLVSRGLALKMSFNAFYCTCRDLSVSWSMVILEAPEEARDLGDACVTKC